MKAFYQHLQKDSFYLVCRCDLNLVPQVEMQEILWRSQNDAYDKPRLLCDRNVQKETSKFSVLVLRRFHTTEKHASYPDHPGDIRHLSEKT